MTPAGTDSVAPIAWEPWTAQAFARAASERKPVLLSLTAAWCHGCDVMDATTYADPRVVQAIADGVVPVRVDTDRRPDVNLRYNLDGWPTTALLTPSGELLTGSTYLTPDAMLSMLRSATDAFRDRHDELMARAREAARVRQSAPAAPRYEPDGEAPRWILSRLLDEEDREHGGFGAGGKFLPAAPLRLALAWQAREPSDAVGGLVHRTLDAVCRGGMFDEVEGGFFRYAAGRDFTRPHTEKLLEDQAAMVAVLLEASRLPGGESFARRARDVIGYVHRTLSDPAGDLFFASQQADDEYYRLSGSIRASLDPPRVDRTPFTDLNAQAIAVWLDAADILADPDLRERAVRAADRVLVAAATPAGGLRHWPEAGAPEDLLADQVHGAWALLRLGRATGRPDYPMLAAAVMARAGRTLWDEQGGGFFDRPADAEAVGLLRDRRKPLALNSLAARVLLQLAAGAGSDELRVRARRTLGAVTATYRADGLAAAPYALAVLELSHADRGDG